MNGRKKGGNSSLVRKRKRSYPDRGKVLGAGSSAGKKKKKDN